MKYWTILLIVLFYGCTDPDGSSNNSHTSATSSTADGSNGAVTDTSATQRTAAPVQRQADANVESSIMDSLKEHKSKDTAFPDKPRPDTSVPAR
jgi:hypothetical protein